MGTRIGVFVVMALSLVTLVASPAIGASYSFTTIDFGGITEALGINAAGEIAGFSGSLGFVRDTGGMVTTVNVPNSSGTIVDGINTSGQIVGSFQDVSGTHGFLAPGPSGPFTTLPNGPASGINDAGQIVGTFTDNHNVLHGLLQVGGMSTLIDVPGAFETISAAGINNAGQIVGSFIQSNRNHGYLDTGGVFTTIDAPGSAFFTRANGINDADQIVGQFFDNASVPHGFLDVGGAFTTIDVPGASQTNPIGINNAGQIAGVFVGTNGGGHGFLATPTPTPEPSTLLLLSVGLPAVAVGARRLRRKGDSS